MVTCARSPSVRGERSSTPRATPCTADGPTPRGTAAGAGPDGVTDAPAASATCSTLERSADARGRTGDAWRRRRGHVPVARSAQDWPDQVRPGPRAAAARAAQPAGPTSVTTTPRSPYGRLRRLTTLPT